MNSYLNIWAWFVERRSKQWSQGEIIMPVCTLISASVDDLMLHVYLGRLASRVNLKRCSQRSNPSTFDGQYLRVNVITLLDHRHLRNDWLLDDMPVYLKYASHM